MATTEELLAEALEACSDLGKQFAAQTVVLIRARRERDAFARRLATLHREHEEASRLVGYALHLRMYGERAPGGDETWTAFDKAAEGYLRERYPDPQAPVPGAVFGAEAGPEWHHGGSCSWPERACTGHVTSYSPVQVPENTGKHPEESTETGADR